MGIAAYDELVALSDRLYCAWQCALNGDPMMYDHHKKVGGELAAIWSSLERIIDDEHIRLHRVEEELKKFEQGFAYKSPNGQVLD